jgi:hypothetical protein
MAQVVSWHRKYLVTISLALLSGCFPVISAFADANLPGRDCHASFSCPVGTSAKCWFTIAMSSGTKTFTVAAGAGHCRDINMACARN